MYAKVPNRPNGNTFVVCNNVCRSSPGCRKHVAVHNSVSNHADSINRIKDAVFMSHICLIHMKSYTSPNSHLRSDGCRKETEDVTNDAMGEEGGSLLSKIWQSPFICLRVCFYLCVSECT